MKKIVHFIKLFLFFVCFWYAGISVQAAHPVSGSTTADNLIKSYESCRLTAYKAVSSETYYTIGWGHYGPDVRAGMKITQAQADAYFNNDIKKFESYLNTFLDQYNISVTQAQYDALLSFTYNLGNRWASTPTFKLKTILINGCNNYTSDEIRTAFTNWNKAGGVVLSGLVRRRNAEADLFLSDMNTNNNTNASTSVNGNNPEGNIDVITGHLQSVRVAGWAFDRDNAGESIGIHVYIGTECIGAFIAEDARPDVDEAYACGMYHGFDKMLTISQTGTQKIDVYAINIDGGSNILIGSSTVTVTADTEQPVISDASVSKESAEGYTISCKARDNTEVDYVTIYTWTEEGGQDDLTSVNAVKDGDIYTCTIYSSDHLGRQGTYVNHIYAYDKFGNCSAIAINAAVYEADKEQPVISDVSVSKESAEGYTISCKARDNTEVDYVTIYTWTEEGGQDDLTSVNAVKDGDIYTCTIYSSDHLGRQGTYVNHIYAYDKSGNYSAIAINAAVYDHSYGGNSTEIENDTNNSGIMEDTKQPDVNEEEEIEQEDIVLKPTDLRANPTKKTIKIKKSFKIQIGQRHPEEWEDYSNKEWKDIYKNNIKNVIYMSSKSSVASVNKKTGKVTGKRRGNVTIRTIIYFNSGKAAAYKTKVYVKK